MNNLDYKTAKETILEKRVPFFEYVKIFFMNTSFILYYSNIHEQYYIFTIYLRLRPITEEASAAELTNQADTEWGKSP